MPLPPLPDIPCVRCSLTWKDDTGNLSGTRFYIAYSGSAPSSANCITLASNIGTDWNTNLSGSTTNELTLTEVDVLDIATRTGASGVATPNAAGGLSGARIPIQVAMNVHYNIARRYRGGKPRGYWPFGSGTQLADEAHWTSSFITGVTTNITAFFAAIAGYSIGSMGTLKHVNLSFYSGFTNPPPPPGHRAESVPTYRATALHDDVTGYTPQALLSSQRRRRQATTP